MNGGPILLYLFFMWSRALIDVGLAFAVLLCEGAKPEGRLAHPAPRLAAAVLT